MPGTYQVLNTCRMNVHMASPDTIFCGDSECDYLLTIVYTMDYYSAITKNSFESVLMRWMKLEPIIQSEVSQKDKDHYNILTHIYGI